MSQAVGHANFGYPIRGRGPLGLLRRALGRIIWPLTREQIELNRSVIEVANDLNFEVTDLREHVLSFRRAIENFENAFDNVDDAFVAFERQERLLGERLDLAVRQTFLRYQEGVGALQRDIADLSQDLARTLEESERSSSQNLKAVEERLQKVERGLAEVRYRIGQVDLFLNEVKRALPQPPAEERLAALPGALANLYPSIEVVLRGTEDEIKERVRVYIEDVAAVTVEGRVLDLGCGRAEWLELLRDAKIDAYGIDRNEQYVKEGIRRGLDVRHADALEHLKGLPEGELRAITAIHLIEHLGIEMLLEVLDLSLRALRPGGLLILETPDPENLLVGASSFYLDPTHVHPIPPMLLSFLVGARGFTDVVVRKMKRTEPLDSHLSSDAPWSGDLERVWGFIANRIVGPEDYAVLGQRA